MNAQKHIHPNPMVQVEPQTRKTLKMLAAWTGETMLDVIRRLATQELERIQHDQQYDQDKKS